MNHKWKFAKAAADRISGVGKLRCLAMFLWAPFGAVSAAGQTSGFVYVASNYSYDVSAYTIDGTTGGLTVVSGSPFSAGTQPVAVTVDPTGKFVYVVNYDNVPALGNISAYIINGATGALTAVPGSPFPAGFLPYSVTIDSTGHFAYVANAGSNNVSAYTIVATTGALTAIPSSPFPAGSAPYSVTVDPAGHFAYVANAGSNNVSAYTIVATTGALTAIPGSPFPAGSGPHSITVDPAGHFAYVANVGSNDVSAYTIDGTTGALTSVSGSPFPAGSGPASVAVDPTGQFAYVANCGSFCVGDLYDPGNISAYTIDATTGALIALPGSPFPAGYYPDSVAVLPSGRFLYVTNCGNSCVGDGAFVDPGDVSAYSIDGTTGALTAVPGSPFPAGYSPMGVAATVGATRQAAVLSVSPNGVSFANQLLNTTSAAQAIIVSNSGGTSVQITGITTAGDFAQTNGCGAAVAPNSVCNVYVTFTPIATGTRTGSMTVNANTTGAPVIVSLAGTGVYPAMSESPHSLSFGNQIAGSSSAPQTVILSNTGTAPLPFNAIYTTGDFSETTACSSPLVPGTSCSITIMFTPTARYARTGTLVISSSQISQTDTVTLSGTGTVAIAQLSPGSLNFGNQRVNTSSASHNVTLSNTGDGPLTLSALFTTGPYRQTNNCGSSIAPGTGCNMAVVFTPTVRGTVSGTLSITANQQGTAPVTALVGTGH
jgi:6-phosphogluconolactonase